MSSEQPGIQANTSLLSPDAATTQHGEFSVVSPSARTSFTRVDMTTEEAGTNDGGAVGVRLDDVEVEPEQTVPQISQVGLTFLLVSGRRRNMSFEPETTIGRVKELAWNAWPNEWQDERPPAPSYLRILYLGKILQDEDTLLKVGFRTHVPSSAGDPASVLTIVHLSIRAHPPPGAKDAPKKMSLRRGATMDGDGERHSAGCCSGCVVV